MKRYNEQLIQNGNTWKNHFQDLYREHPKNQAQEQISEKLKDLERVIKSYQTPQVQEL